jgi:hypothetical protein
MQPDFYTSIQTRVYNNMQETGQMNNTIATTIKNLEANNMRGYYLERTDGLIPLLSELIGAGSTVGCGDSITLEQTGVFDFLRSSGCIFYDKHAHGLTPDDKRGIYLKNFHADTFITGTNAVTENGELFNIDGNGSRVAPMIYGPKQVIVIVGANKITKDAKSAVERARQIAAPLDAKRLEKNTPCAATGHCADCRHPERICNNFVLIARQFEKNRINVIIIGGKPLGY